LLLQEKVMNRKKDSEFVLFREIGAGADQRTPSGDDGFFENLCESRTVCHISWRAAALIAVRAGDVGFGQPGVVCHRLPNGSSPEIR
jgi:hypothetical protein